MTKQFAVLGLGSFGYSMAITLEELGCEVVAVDSSEDKVQQIADEVSYAVCADIQDKEFIKAWGARNLDGVVVAISENLEVSILATLLAKELGAPYVLAKAQSDIHADILKKLGADKVVFPEQEMGRRVAKTLATKNFTDWISLSTDFSMVEAPLPEAWVGKCLLELNVREKFGINVVGIIRNQQVTVNIQPQECLEAGDMMILIGENKVLNDISKGNLV